MTSSRVATLSVCVLLSALVAVVGQEKKSLPVVKAAAAPAGLAGSWRAVKAERNGKPAKELVGHVLTMKGERFTIHKGKKLLYEGTLKVDKSKRPARIDFVQETRANKGKVWKGIYKLDKNELITCDNAPDIDKPRPTKFEAKAGSGHVLFHFERTK